MKASALGTKVYIKAQGQWQEVACVTSVSGLAVAMEKRNRTSLVDEYSIEKPSRETLAQVTLDVNMVSIARVTGMQQIARDLLPIDVVILFSGTFNAGAAQQGSEYVWFSAYVDSVTWSNLAAEEALAYTLQLSLTNTISVAEGVLIPFVDNVTFTDGIYWR